MINTRKHYKFKDLFKPVDLTTGHVLKIIIIFAIPILLSNILGNAFSLLNSIVLKNTVGGDAVTSMNSTGSISSLLFNFAYGCSGGFAIIASNKCGTKDELGLQKAFISSIFLCLIIGLIISLLAYFLKDSLLVWLNIDEKFISEAKAYFGIIALGFIFILLNNLFGNYLRALGNSMVPLLISLGTTLINILLAYLLTGVIHLSTRGCAIATIIANLIGLIVNYIYMIKKYKYLRFTKESIKFDKEMYVNLLKMGIPLGFQWSILFIGSFVQSSSINKFGPDATKAVTCYSNWESYLYMPLSTISSAILSFVGQNYGAKNYQRIKEGIKDTFIINLVIYGIILIVALPTVQFVPYIFLKSSEINNQIMFYCSTYLYILIPNLIFQGLLMMCRSCLQGIKKPLIPFFSGIGELLARIFVCLLIPLIIDSNNPLSDKAFIGISFSTPSAWIISFLIMGYFTLKFILLNKKFTNNEFSELNKDVNNKENV